MLKKIYAKLDKFTELISNFSLSLIVVIGIFMLFLTVISVVFRYALHNSLTWGEEVLKMSLVWFGLLSVGVIARKREHVGIVIFKEHMPPKVQVNFGLISQILLLFASIAMTVIGVAFVIKSGSQLTPALRIPYAYGYSAIPVSFAFMTIYEVRNTMHEFMCLTNKNEEN